MSILLYSLFPTSHAAAAKLLQLCPILCDPRDCSPPGSSVPGILQARILEWVAFPSPRYLPDPGINPTSPALTGRFFTPQATREALTGYKGQ